MSKNKNRYYEDPTEKDLGVTEEDTLDFFSDEAPAKRTSEPAPESGSNKQGKKSKWEHYTQRMIPPAPKEEIDAGDYSKVIEENEFDVFRRDGFSINENGVLFAYSGKEKDVTIPEGVTEIKEGAFKDSDIVSVTFPASVKTMGKGAFNGCKKLRRVTLNEGLTEIADETFFDCLALCDINFPSTLTRIGESAFWACESLVSVIMPNSITEIGQYAFLTCFELQEVKLSIGIRTIGERVFCNCSELREITIPDAVWLIGESAFFGCSSLKKVTFGKSVREIGRSAFQSCNSLSSISFPSGLQKIGESAFAECGLTEVTLPDGVEQVGKNVFANCPKLKKLHLGSGFVNMPTPDIVKDCPSLKKVTFQATQQKYHALDPMDGWGAYDFKFVCVEREPIVWKQQFKKFMVLSIVLSIALFLLTIFLYVFYDVNGYYDYFIYKPYVTLLPQGLSLAFAIAAVVFYRLSPSKPKTKKKKRVSVILLVVLVLMGFVPFLTFGIIISSESSDIRGVSHGFFYSIQSDGTVCITEKVLAKGEIVIPSTLKGRTVTAVGDFGNNNNITSVVIPDTVTTIKDRAFAFCHNLRTVDLPDSVISVGNSAFASCTNLKGILYDNAFYLGNENNPYTLLLKATDTNITSCEINENTKLIAGLDNPMSVGRLGFSSCSELIDLKIPSSVVNICNNAFAGCNALSTIVVEEGNTKYYSVGNCLIDKEKDLLMLGCKNSDVSMADGVRTIGGSAFFYCNDLISVSIPKSVTKIENEAFYKCTNLTHVEGSGYAVVTIAKQTKPVEVVFRFDPSIPGNAFSNNETLVSITISTDITEIKEKAFSRCLALKTINYQGTIEEWNSIKKGYRWNENVPGDFTIHCTDGDLDKNGKKK